MAQYDSAIRSAYMIRENIIEKEAYNNKYLNLLSKAYYMPKAFARKMQEDLTWKAELEIVQVPYNSPLVSDDKITVTDNEVKEWYEANKYRFKQEQEHRVVDYVIFNVQPSEADLREIEAKVADMYDEFTKTDNPKLFVNRLEDSYFDSAFYKIGKLPAAIDTALFFAPAGTFLPPYNDGKMWTFAKLLAAETRPDSINVSFLFIADEGLRQDARRKKEESKLILDSAFRAVMSGMDFYAVAEKYSDFPIAQMPDSGRVWLADGVNTGFFMGDDQPFFDTLYSFHNGAIVKREIQGGSFIFKINEKTAAERKVQVAIGRKAIEASTETIENIENAANNFANGTDDYKKFSDAVVRHNLNKRTNDHVEKMTFALPGTYVAGTSGSTCRDIIKWIYAEDTKKGNVSIVYSLENMYVIVVLKDIYEKGYRTLENEQMKEYAETMAKHDKKLKMLEDMLKKSLAEKKSITAIAEKYGTQVDSTTISFGDRYFSRFGPENKVMGKIFAQKETKMDVYKGENGVYAVKINKFDMPAIDAENNNSDMYIQQAAMMYQNRISYNNGASKALRKLYNIEDNRSEVF
jgi:peptidyl-prolyl cis-trans isomerase D